ncbi:MAG: hypothetical protein ACKO26_19770 [Planctomycetota bacterium]
MAKFTYRYHFHVRLEDGTSLYASAHSVASLEGKLSALDFPPKKKDGIVVISTDSEKSAWAPAEYFEASEEIAWSLAT